MDNTKLLGEEKIPKLLLKFSVPCVTGLLVSAFYNIVDQIFIGNSSLGYLGNAATGIPFPIICIANACAWCVGDGAAAYLSICAGRDDRESAHKSVGTGISASLLVSLILMAFCWVFQTPLMTLFGASEQTLGLTLDYFRIIVVFFPCYLLLNVMNSMIRADGSPTYAMVAMSLGAVINIILDPVFIFMMDWGIKGAAIATVIGQVASFLVCVVYFFKPKTFHLTWQSFRIDLPILKTLINMGGSTFITQIALVVMTALSNVILFRYGSLSKFGSDIPISVFSIQTKVYTIVNNLVVGIALGSQPILGYNYGANRTDRVRETYKWVLYASLTVGTVATLIFELCPQVLINLFGTQSSPLYQEFAIKTFRIYLSMSILTCVIKMTSVFFQAIGKATQAMIASVVRDIICFVVFTIALSHYLETRQAGDGVYGILFAAPLADIVAGIVVVLLTVPFFHNLDKAPVAAMEKQPEAVLQKSHPGVIVTIAREHGSQGKEIGRLLAKRLGIPFYYKEMTALAAQESGLAQEFVSDINMNADKWFHQMYLSSDVVKQAMIAQEKIIHKIAEQGSCVIVGRAADYVLRDNENVKSIFLYGPEEYRIRNIMKMYGDTYEAAAEHMAQSDEARASYYQGISGQNWRSMAQYDLCLDTSIGLEAAVDVLAEYLQQAKQE